jgi:hypothetical protein
MNNPPGMFEGCKVSFDSFEKEAVEVGALVGAGLACTLSYISLIVAGNASPYPSHSILY